VYALRTWKIDISAGLEQGSLTTNSLEEGKEVEEK